ncbi:MAG TPA: alpha/beta hydrolase [Cytophagales bacterium]|nr:alpha/beta hydrolase [Cytophagales bacterium]
MDHIAHNRVNIDFQESGSGDTTLLFIHGSYINKEYWSAQVAHFSSKYHVVTLDLGGHGKSGRNRSNWSQAEFAEDVISVMVTLNLSNVILIGHSLGADIALEVIDRHPGPIIGFVAVDYFKLAMDSLPPEVQQQFDQIINQLKENFADTNEHYVRQGLVSPLTDPAIVDRVINDYRSAYPEMGLAVAQELFSNQQRQRDLLKKLKLKLYLINVDYVPTQESFLRENTPSGYELDALHGSCHYPMLELPEQFNSTLEGIIEKCEREVRLVNL